MTDALSTMIARAIDLKQGNKEFALFYDFSSTWLAQIGNTSQYVGLGEGPAEVEGCGDTPESAVDHLIKKLQEIGG